MSDYLSKMGESYDKKKSEAPRKPKPVKRPLGLTIVCIGAVIAGLFFLLVSLFTFVRGAAGTYETGGFYLLLGIVQLLSPMLFFLFAIGAWKRKGWALYLGLLLMAWEFGVALLRLLGGTAFFWDPLFMILELVGFAYLLHPRTRSVFESVDPTRAD